MQRRISVLLVCCALAASAREESTRDFRKSVPLPAGRTFRIEHSLGNLTIRGQAKNEVDIIATIRCSAPSAQEARQCADRIQIRVEDTGAGVSVRTEYPPNRESFFHWRDLGYSVNYDISMPDSAVLEVRNSFGRVSASGLHAGAAIHNGNGSVQVASGKGNQRIDNSFGEVIVLGNDGDVTVVNANGRVEARDVTGALDIRDRFGNVQVSGAGKTVNINSGNGRVEVVNAKGTVTVSNSFGAADVSLAKADVTVRNQNGSVDASDISGTADLNTTFAPVKFARIGKALRVNAQNSTVTGDTVGESAAVETTFGGIDVRNVKGGARATAANSSIRLAYVTGQIYAKTSFAGVTVDDATGPVTVEAQNGSVAVDAKSTRSCQPISVRTSFAPIRVTLPGSVGYNLAASTSFGRIQSQPEITVSGVLGRDHLNGKIRGGGCDLRLMNQNGNIDIQ